MGRRTTKPAPVREMIEAAGFDLTCVGKKWMVSSSEAEKSFQMVGEDPHSQVREWLAWELLKPYEYILVGEVKRRATRLWNHSDKRDIIQEAWIRAHRILQSWDPAKGSLAVFARQSIRYGVGIAIQEIVSSSEARSASFGYALTLAWDHFKLEKGRAPTPEELSVYGAQFTRGRSSRSTPIPMGHVLVWLEHGQATIHGSLSQPIGDGNAVVGDLVAGGEPSPERLVSARERLDLLEGQLKTVDKRGRDMLLRHHQGETYADIGRSHGLSRERVRQIIGKVKRELSHLK